MSTERLHFTLKLIAWLLLAFSCFQFIEGMTSRADLVALRDRGIATEATVVAKSWIGVGKAKVLWFDCSFTPEQSDASSGEAVVVKLRVPRGLFNATKLHDPVPLIYLRGRPSVARLGEVPPNANAALYTALTCIILSVLSFASARKVSLRLTRQHAS